jgi:predicted dehydrogenase
MEAWMHDALMVAEAAGPPLRCAVIGAGHMGSLHARKYSASPDWDLVAVADIDAGAAERAASRANATPVVDYGRLLGKVDAVTIAVPTPAHHRVARDFLAAGSHVLVEKPIAATIDEADDLIRLARRMERTLQVGHVERFNSALMALDLKRSQPRFIEATRNAPFKIRGSEVSVVLDLMIHDIDLILDIVDSEIASLHATGSPVLSDDIDIANVRIAFANGCVANVTASRVSQEQERTMRLLLPDGFMAIDFMTRTVRRRRVGERPARGGRLEVPHETLSFESADALETQLAQFAYSIRYHKEPPTSGAAARRALAVAMQIGLLLGR